MIAVHAGVYEHPKCRNFSKSSFSRRRARSSVRPFVRRVKRDWVVVVVVVVVVNPIMSSSPSVKPDVEGGRGQAVAHGIGIGGKQLSGMVPQDVKAVRKLVGVFDLYHVKPRKPSIVGGLVSLAIIPATAVFVWALYADLRGAPPVEAQEILWTYASGPYEATLRCEVTDGCWVSNKYGTDSHHPEGLVASEGDCVFLAQGANTTLHLGYSFEPTEGLSVIAKRPSPYDPNAKIASLLSDMNFWKGEFIENGGVMPFWSYGVPGTTSITLVKTHNATLDSDSNGRNRVEYFLQHVSSESDPLDNSYSDCATVIANSQTWSSSSATHSHMQTRFRLAPEFYSITVSKQWNSVLAFFGASSGVWAAFITWGSLIVASSEWVKFVFCGARRDPNQA